MSQIKNKSCAECGMPVEWGEYHPEAACLMYRACGNREVVRNMLTNLITHWFEQGVQTMIEIVANETGMVIEFDSLDPAALLERLRLTKSELSVVKSGGEYEH